LKMGLIGCPETLVRNYNYSLCINSRAQVATDSNHTTQSV